MGPRIFFPVVDGEESKMVTQTEWVQVSPCCRCCFSQLGFGCWHKCIGKKVGSSNCLLECPNTVRPSRARVLLDILLFWYKGGCCTISPCCWSFFNNFFFLNHACNCVLYWLLWLFYVYLLWRESAGTHETGM